MFVYYGPQIFMEVLKRSRIRFGVFEVDPQARELRKQGFKVKLQEQPFQILLMLLERPGEVVTREEIRKRLWPADTFVDFDSGLNRATNRLRESLGDDAENPRFVETLPRRGYRFIAPVEARNEDSIETAPPKPDSVLIPTEAPTRSSQSARWIFALAAVLAGIVISLLALKSGGILSHFFRHAGPEIKSIAVLPLQNLSGDPAQDYFSDGLTDELITEVAKIGALRVISRTSSMQYKGTHKSLPAIAKELGVDALVEGTVVRSGDRVRVTAQLIDARDDRHIWSEAYDRNVVDVLPLQSEVAQTIAEQVRVKLTSEQHTSLAGRHRVNSQSLEAYLKGSYFLNQGIGGLDKSIGYFSEAIQLDPSNAQAYAGLSQSYLLLGIFGLHPSKEVYPKARAAARKAIEIDATFTDAHAVLAEVAKGFDWDWTVAESEYKRALELNPSSSNTHALYADYLSMMGRHDEAIVEMRRSHELDPVSIMSNAFFGFLYYRARRYDEAIALCRQSLELAPNYPNANWFMALALEKQGRVPEAITGLQSAVNHSGAPLFLALLGHAYGLAGKKADASNTLEELKARSQKQYVSPLDFALVYIGLDDRDMAFHWLETAYSERVMRIQELNEPHFDSLRGDPRYSDLLRRIGIPP
jgi:TolB-like protein/DNA-binding winged helix-turn-helix (wHTH) protein/tetratricopeptide (TPR) repeat protein